MNKPGRSDPCPCGSGRKYKQCCSQRDEALAPNRDPAAILVPKVFQAALDHHQAGRLPQAETLYEKILRVEPGHPDTLHLLGVLALQGGKNEIAIERINKAIHVNPSSPVYYSNLGAALKNQGRLDEAVENYRKALLLKPDFAEAHLNLGNALKNQGNLEAAAESCCRALSLRPNYAEAHNNLGTVLQAQGELGQALECYQKALLLKPNYAEAHSNLGAVLQEQGKLDEALACYQKVLSLKPDYAEAHYGLGNISRAQGNLDTAIKHYHSALSLKPDYAEARWALAMSKIPIIYGYDDSATICRKKFSMELDELSAWFDAGRMALGYKAVGTQDPFYLAYQEENNRDLLSRYGALCARLMKHWLDKQEIPRLPIVPGLPVRIGIVSAHIYDQSVWAAIVKGWVQHLDRDRFELHIFHVSSVHDKETDWAIPRLASYKQGKGNLLQWVEDILLKQPDVLIYPAISMDSMTAKLASLRLAPIQMAAWGHAETTGLPTMDYYLSAEDMEPPDAQNNYAEKLVALPHLGCCYAPLRVVGDDKDLSGLCLDPASPILICPGTPFKYVPQNDHVFVEVARKLGRCQFIFFTYRICELTDKLRQRLTFVFAQSGLDFNDYAVFIQWQKKSAFYGLMKQADVFMDTIGFSGFNTAMQAVECGLPIVTKEGRFMRGRLASGILRRMGMKELIANTEEEYIDLVVKLAQDAEYWKYIRHCIETSRHVLFEDMEAVRGLEDFLISLTEKT